MGRQSIVAGALMRRAVRRYLLEMNIHFLEEKGFIDSVFYFNVDDGTYRNMQQDINRAIQNRE